MKKKSFLVFVMAVIFLFQAIMPGKIAMADNTDLTNAFQFVTDVKITDANGKELGNDISKNSEIHINYTWSIPNEQTVDINDYYTMQLPVQISITKAIDLPINNPADGSNIASLHVGTDGKIKITFTNYLGEHSNVNGGFSLDCHFNESQIGNVNPVSISFTVPGKGVIVVGPINFQQPDPTVTKIGTYDSAADEITWTITANKEGVRLDNATITDIINSGQVFLDNSVTINSSAAVQGTDFTYDTTDSKLVLNLKDITSQQVIKFKTSIHDDLAAKPQGTYNYSNTATLNYDNGTPKSITSNTSKIPVAVKYIDKNGTYDAANKKIDWTIKVNESARTINNAVVTDTIPAGLTLDTTTIELNGVPADSASYTLNGQDFTYNLGNITSLQTITFSTSVDPTIYNTNTAKTYSNTAVLSGDGVLTGTSSSKSVGVNPNIIQKQGTSYDASQGIITWKITVNNNKTTVAAGATVTDNIPKGQTYVPNSAYLDGSNIGDGGYADALAGDTTKTGTFTYTFPSSFSDTHVITLKTKVVDPKAYRANFSGNYNNSVTLTSADINQTTTGAQTVNSEVISKTGAGYDYAAREITWQVKINKNRMPITNAVVTDNIPAGQEYVPKSASIDGGADVEGFDYKGVTGDSTKTGTLLYTFSTGSTINSTYTITYKTKVTDLSVFNINGDRSIANTATIAGDGIPMDGNRSGKGTQTIHNTVISKNPTYTNGNSYIDWTLNVNSNFSINMAQATITDTLQDGLSLNTDSVALYEGVVNPSNGNLTQGAKVSLAAENVKYVPSTRRFDFTFPADAGTKAYILKFATDAAKPGNYSNTVEFKGGSADQSATGAKNGVWFANASAWGTGESGSITVVKVDQDDTTKILPGAVFQLLDQYGNVKTTSAATGADGTVLFKGLKYDLNYTVKEVTPPVGYNLSNEAYTFQIHDAVDQKNISYTYKDSKIIGNIQFTKTGEDGNGLQGAEFALYQNDGTTPVTDGSGKDIKAISDVDGKVQFSNIEYGNYKIRETKAPEGYLLSNDVLTVKFNSDSSTTVTPNSFSNQKIKGGIKITKTDAATSAPLPGATIAVYTSDGRAVSGGLQGVTGADGTIEFDNLVYGNYYFVETNAPTGYVLSTARHPFSIKDNGVIITATFSNQKPVPGGSGGAGMNGKIEFTKTGDDGKGLQGAEFTLYKSDGVTPVADVAGKIITAISDVDGKVQFNNIEPGNYKVRETKAPKGYILSNTILTATFSINSQNAAVTPNSISNQKIKGGIRITKTDAATSLPVAGATIAVYTSDGKQVGSGLQGITKVDGTVEFDNLPFGEYYFIETSAPAGYLLNTDKHPFSIKENGVIVTAAFSNQKAGGSDTPGGNGGTNTGTIKGGIKITKTDASTALPVPGATITVYTNDGKIVGSGVQGVTGADGTVEFDNLASGDYYFIETNAPSGYLLNTDKHPFSIKENGVIVTATFSDQKAGGSTSTGGSGGTSNPTPASIKVRGNIQFTKVGEDGKGLQGAEFTLYENDGITPVTNGHGKNITVVSDEDGKVQFSSIEHGSYKIKETKAPKGYVISNDLLNVTLKGDADNTTVKLNSVSNQKIRGGIKITKTDASTSQPVPGATITAYTSDGKVIGSGVQGVTGNDGTVEFDDLVYGEYYFIETNAPKGYLLNTDKHLFSIKENGTIISSTFSDQKDLINISIDQNNNVHPNSVENPPINQVGEIKNTEANSIASQGEEKAKSTEAQNKKATAILPQTGGFVDTTVLILAGLISILAGAGLMLMQKARRIKKQQ